MRRISLVVIVLATLTLSCKGGGTNPDGGGGGSGGGGGGVPPPPPPAPTITGISPTFGTNAGGTQVTVTGTNFVSGATLDIGGSAATNVTVTATSLTATTGPRQTPGPVNVQVRNPDGQTATRDNGFTYFLLRANPGGPYTSEGNRNIVLNGTASIGNPFPITRFLWNCGQNPHGKPCDQDTPTPEFEYRQEGARGSPDRTYTVTLRVVDTMGNSDTQTTTVRVRQTY